MPRYRWCAKARASSQRTSRNDEVIREAWQPVNMRYADRPQPLVTAFMNKYRQHIRGSPMEVRRLDAQTLQVRARKMGENTANGIDLWSIRLLKRLPGVFWDRTARGGGHEKMAGQSGRRFHIAGAQGRRGRGPHEAETVDIPVLNIPNMGRGAHGRRHEMAGNVGP